MQKITLLDSILKVIYIDKEIDLFKLGEKLLTEKIIENKDLKIVEHALSKLINDGYITVTTSETFNQITKNKIQFKNYTITWEGAYFITDGGYVKQYIRENDERERLINLEISNENSQKQIAVFTRWIMCATIISGIYYLIEIIKLILCFF